MTQIIPAFNIKPKTLALVIATSILSLSVIGCGSDSGGGSSGNNGSSNGNSGGSDGNGGVKPPVSSTGFTESATWELTNLAAGTATCYDFDAKAESSCDDNKWDIKYDNTSRQPKLWSNSGDSGAGKGGVFGLIEWSDLGRYTNATKDPDTSRDITMHYNEDRSGGIFDAQPWFEYNLKGNHQLYPNNRVYMITTNYSDAAVESSIQQPIYAMQIINYYNNTGASGYPTLRWIDTALPNQVRTQTISAASNDDWVYFDLKAGKPTTKEGTWHVGFKRSDVILNGGDSAMGSNQGKVGGFLSKTPAGYYSDKEGSDKGKPIASKFITDNSAATLTDLTNTAGYAKPTSAHDWIIDKKGSDLNPAYSGTFPNLDYGWYTYNGATHQLNAKPIDKAKGALIRSAEGNSYARVRLDKINYPDNKATTASSWEFKFDIQPAS